MYRASHRREIERPPALAFAPIRRIGGETGWYAFDGLWRARAFVDRVLGGVGAGRGRRDPEQLRVGDAIDWWVVEAYEPDRRLCLRAEMNLPGRAWLEFEVEPTERGAVIQQTSLFEPAGILGRLYWYAVYPLHDLVFRGMLNGIVRAGREPITQGADQSARRNAESSRCP